MNCLIIDDNKIARSILKQLVAQRPGLDLLGECENAADAYKKIVEGPVDLLLLDIEMPGMTGLELARNVGSQNPFIIFTTAKKDYAAEAFDLNVVDYLVKPIAPARFFQAIQKVEEMIGSREQRIQVEQDDFIFIRDANIIRRLGLDDILYAEAMGDYVKLYTANKFYAVHTTLKSIEDKLPAARFLRVHRSFIIQVNKIDAIQDGALIINGKPLPVADAYRNTLNKRMKII
ncbi:MAG: response regulator transcription factor [Chitinophagaceae bacterium]|nr:response regulator transcription factor [Chitinophagaceae bacterium]